MADVTARLREAYEAEGYAVDSVTDNRGRLSVAIREDGPDADDLRRIAQEVCGDEGVVGLDVTAESIAGDDVVRTVVAFRYRP